MAQVLSEADRRVAAAQAVVSQRRVDLPLRFWNQSAHFTTPAADEQMARKAVEGGTAVMARLMGRWQIEPAELADRLTVDVDLVRDLLESSRRPPLVMLDGEDAQALREDVTRRGLENAADVLATADWGSQPLPTLRFFRPPGFGLGSTARDLYTLLWALAERAGDGPFPLDGIVFPKIEQPEEVDELYYILDEAEAALGLQSKTIRVAYLVESGWSAAQLAAIAQRGVARLCALIFGLADYSADLALPWIRNDHPLADWARAEIVNVAGAVGVPAIDGMTLDYPVADPALDDAANRQRFIDRVALVYDDAVRARSMGMAGKWVGHPAQLFAVMLAYEIGLTDEALAAEADKLEAYRVSVEDEARGATMIGGVMSDRATDRHARAMLRRAVAMGRFDARRAAALGIASEEELTGREEGRGG